MRDPRLDTIRSTALLMIILVHTWSLSGIQEMSDVLSSIYHVLYVSGVPMFIMLSGALVLGGREMSLGEFYTRRFTRLLIPFLFWSGLVYVLSCIAGKYPEVTSLTTALGSYIPRLMTNGINEAYWYVQMIGVLYLITPFLQRSLRLATDRELSMVIAVGIVLMSLAEFVPSLYWNRYISHLLSPLLYYLFGYLIYRIIDTKEKKTILPVGGVLLLIGITGTVLHRNGLTTWIQTASLFTLLLCTPKRPIRVTKTISDYSYATYLSHIVLVGPLYGFMHWDAATAPVWQMALLPISMAVLVLGVCTIAHRIIHRIIRTNSIY